MTARIVLPTRSPLPHVSLYSNGAPTRQFCSESVRPISPSTPARSPARSTIRTTWRFRGPCDNLPGRVGHSRDGTGRQADRQARCPANSHFRSAFARDWVHSSVGRRRFPAGRLMPRRGGRHAVDGAARARVLYKYEPSLFGSLRHPLVRVSERDDVLSFFTATATAFTNSTSSRT